MEIRKKCWPEFFHKILEGKKKFDVRLADFEIKEGDILILEEYDPKTKSYTGRSLRKKVNFVTKFDITNFWDIKDIKKFGVYGIGLE